MRRAMSLRAAFIMIVGIAIAMNASCVAAQDQNQDDPLLSASDPDPDQTWIPVGDFWTGYDHVSGIPNNRDDVSRLRARVRVGTFWNPTPTWEIGGVARFAQGTDSNDDNRRNNDNERSDDIALDQLFIRWRPGENTSVTLGKAPLPLEFSPMVWDQDFRPAGIAFDQSIPIGEFDRLQFVGGYFSGQNLYGDQSRVTAAQIALRWHEGAPLRGSVLLSYLGFADLDELTLEGLTRTNTVVAGHLVNDYRLVDLQFVGHAEVGHWPIDARIDLLTNQGADDSNDGARASLSIGDRTKPRGWEFGYAFQRIQRDAAMAAFNSDDWWFHSAVRGHLVWIGYGIDATWSLRLAGFHELRDGLDEYTDRIRLDLTAHW
jgi:hypothetical protein